MHTYQSRPFSFFSFAIPFIAFALIVFNAPAFVYLFVLIVCIYSSRKLFILPSFDYPVLLLFILSAFSLLLRGFPVADIPRILQFFLGSLFFVLLIVRSEFPFFYFRLAFVLLTLYEYVYSSLFSSPPFFVSLYFSRINVDAAVRSLSALDGINRLYGPSFNASVTGSILGAFCLCWLFDRTSLFHGAPCAFMNKYVSFVFFLLCFSLFVLCQSGTAFLVFGFGLFSFSFAKILAFFLKRKSLFLFIVRKTLLLKASFLFILFLSFVFTLPALFDRLAGDYLATIFALKLDQYSDRVSSLASLIFGGSYSSTFILGGDFLFLSLISALGLPLVLFFIILTFNIYFLSNSLVFDSFGPYDNRNLSSIVLILSLFVASFHYGVFFSLYSQIICATFVVPRPSFRSYHSL